MSRRGTAGKAAMRQEIRSSWVGAGWGKDIPLMRRIDRRRRKRAAAREIDAERREAR